MVLNNKVTAQEYKEEVFSYFVGVIEHMPSDHDYAISDSLRDAFEDREYDEENINYDQLHYEVHDEIMKKLEEIRTEWKVGFVPREK